MAKSFAGAKLAALIVALVAFVAALVRVWRQADHAYELAAEASNDAFDAQHHLLVGQWSDDDTHDPKAFGYTEAQERIRNLENVVAALVSEDSLLIDVARLALASDTIMRFSNGEV